MMQSIVINLISISKIMLDIKYIRENQAAVEKAIVDKNINLNLLELIEVDKERVALIQEVEELNSLKNDINEMMKSAKDDDERQEIIAKAKIFKEKLEVKEPLLRDVKEKFVNLMVKVPTVPAADVPVGKSEEDNIVVSEMGEKPDFSFTPKTHIELAESLDLIDFKQGVKTSGYRGYYLKNEGAELVMALMMYAMHKMISKGYAPMMPPTLVKDFALFGTGYFSGAQYDSDVDEVYQVASSDKDASGGTSKEKKFLTGTSEAGLLAYYADKVLTEEELPIKVAGFSQCYRSEIGSYGKDTAGLYRVHEFMKVEMVTLCTADVGVSEKLQEEMVAISQEVHEELGLPYRKLAICSGDMGTGKYRMFDLEAWMPGLNRWGETGSASNFLDWQSRRLNVKYKDKDGKKKYVYMLNNTVLPSARPLIAILENFQQEDGSVVIPEVLRPYMPQNRERIVVKK